MSETTLWMIGGGLAFTLLGGAAAAVVVVRLPRDYFKDAAKKRSARRGTKALILKIAKNVAGILLLAAGIVLSLPGIPGPGIVVALLGLVITDIPGKQKLVNKIVRRPSVLRSLNRVRRRFGRPNLAAP